MKKIVTAISSVAIIAALLDGRPWLAFGFALVLLIVGAGATYLVERIPRTISARIVLIAVLGVAASLVTGLCSSAPDNEKPTHPSMSVPKPRVNTRPLDDDFQKAMEKVSARH